MKSSKFYAAIILVSVVFAVTLLIYPAVSALTGSITLSSSGQIALPIITAESGSASDIQDAVDWIVANSGVGTVYVPAGTYDFVPAGTGWYEHADDFGFVMVPEGVNIIGATPTIGFDGQVTSWATTLKCPTEITTSAPNLIGDAWFFFQGTGDAGLTTRFANIEIIGERKYNYDMNVLGSIGVIFNEVMNYRVDHCNFEDLSNGAIWAGWFGDYSTGTDRMHCNGVIDQNRFVTYNSVPEPYGANGMVDYAIQVGKTNAGYWDDDVTNVFGHYTGYTTFIEDNYFSKWRHCVAGGDGAHYIFRYNTIDNSFGFGDIDAHGTYVHVGTRAIEVYGNTFKNLNYPSTYQAIFHRGGAAIITDNTNDGSYSTLTGGKYDLAEPEKCWVKDTYIWDNSDNWQVRYDGIYTEGVDYFLRAPNMIDDGFTYTPYAYPHPLTQEETP